MTKMLGIIRLLFALIVSLLLTGAAATAQTATQEIQISATVGKSCSINGGSTGVIDTATIPISPAGAVVTTPITPTQSPYLNVVCNAPSTIQLTSNLGAVKNATVAPSGFTNIIDYQASATWNGVTATLDTATTPSAAGSESGTTQPVSAGSDSLSVTITPTANAAPLMGGSYSDSLFVVLNPQ
jgi:hypothetical protein